MGFSYLYMYILMVFFSNDTFPANSIDKAEHSVLFYTHTTFQNMRKASKAYLHHALHLIDDKGKILKKVNENFVKSKFWHFFIRFGRILENNENILKKFMNLRFSSIVLYLSSLVNSM